jgi:hypothetical protein
MSDPSANDHDDDDCEYAGPLSRIRPLARVIFGVWGLFGLAAIAIGSLIVIYLALSDAAR